MPIRIIGPDKPDRGVCEPEVTEEPMLIPAEEPLPAFPEGPKAPVAPIPVEVPEVAWRK